MIRTLVHFSYTSRRKRHPYENLLKRGSVTCGSGQTRQGGRAYAAENAHVTVSRVMVRDLRGLSRMSQAHQNGLCSQGPQKCRIREQAT